MRSDNKELGYEEFKTKVRGLLEEQLGDPDLIRTEKVTKLNGQELDSIYIARKGREMYPTCYLNHLYEMNREGMSLDGIVNMIIDLGMSEPDMERQQYMTLTDWNAAKDRVVVKLINTEMNGKMLEEMPGIPFLDLTVVFSVMFRSGRDSYHAAVNDSLFNDWNVSKEELYRIAFENMKRINPPKVISLSEMLETLCPEVFEDNTCGIDAPEITVIGSEDGGFGAAYMLDDSLLAQAAADMDDDVFIIPSSVHEVLLFPAGCSDREQLDSTVRAVNDSALMPGEYLSDHVYLYSRETGKITM